MRVRGEARFKNIVGLRTAEFCQFCEVRYISADIRAIYTRKNKTRLIFPRINGPIVAYQFINLN